MGPFAMGKCMKIYFAAIIAAFVLCAYLVGVRVGRADCSANVARAASRDTARVIQKTGEINAEVYNTAAGDIRRILRAKYTIAE